MAITKTESGKLRNSNKVVTDIGIDNVPTTGSDNLVTSDGIARALDDKADKNNIYTKQESDDKFKTKQTAVNDPTAGNTPANAFISGITQNANGEITPIKNPLPPFQAPLTFDDTPTKGSSNPVTSDGIKNAIDEATPSDYDTVKAQVQQNTQDISGIEAKIPAQASALNQLADKNFVNSSIDTNTATFRGTYNLVSDLGLTVSATEEQTAAAIATHLASLVPPIVPENNDYVFVQIPRETSDPTVVVRYDRYKCTVTESGGVTTRVWGFEFSLNNSSFTAEQWAAINSGITSGDVAKLGALPTAQELAAALLAKYEKPSTGIPKTDLSSGVQTSLDKADTAIQTIRLGQTAIVLSGTNIDFPISEPTSDFTTYAAADAFQTWLMMQSYARLADAMRFSTAVSYAVGDVVFYNGAFYRCTTAHTAGAWNASHFEEVIGGLSTGTPTAPTPTAGDNSTKVATTAFVKGALPYAIASVPSGDALADRTVNTKTVNAATYAPSFPAETSGKSCDFYLAITSDTAGTVSAPSGKTLYNAKGESANLDYEANKTTVLRFTQIGTNTYVVTGGANGGGGSVDPAQLAGKLNSTSAAPAFSSSATYAVGEHVTYNGKLYKCTTAVSTAGAWNSTNWTAVALAEEIDDKAPLASPAFTGTPTAPTPTSGDNSTKVATTAFVKTAVDAVGTVKANSTAIAPAFSDTSAYTAGKYVTYNGNCYCAVVDVSAPASGSTNPTPDQDIYDDTTTPATGHWELKDINSRLVPIEVLLGVEAALSVINSGTEQIETLDERLTAAETAIYNILHGASN